MNEDRLETRLEIPSLIEMSKKIDEEANLRKLQIEEELIVRYLDRIKSEYSSAKTNQRRRYIAKALEKLIERLSFNPDIAREIREKHGLTQTELASIIGWKQMYISIYEVGNHPPGINYKRWKDKGLFRYLKWLKDNGYNPYNL